MKLKLTRTAKRERYTIGKLYIDGKYFSDTLEDPDRGLKQSMPLWEIQRKKVYGETAIPTGIYKVEVTMSPKFGRLLPRLQNVPGFDGILMHRGNTAADTLGCILVGENKEVGKVINSTIYELRLTGMLKKESNVTIEIV